MKNNILKLFLISISISSLFLYYCVSHPKKHRIAIFEPAVHPAMDEIVDGFITTIKNASPIEYEFIRYNANGNKTLLRSQAEEILHQNYELVMSIGADPSKTLHELSRKKNLTTPIVFTAVSNPVELGIVSSLQSSQNNLTGVEEVPDYEEQLSKLLMVKPTTKTITLVYDPSIKAGIHEVWAQDIKKITDRRGITLELVKVFHINEVQSKVQSLLINTDVVMILTDHTTVSSIDTLITLCNRYNVTLYASDLNSGIKGACLAFGITQYDLGIQAGLLGLKILIDYIIPKDIPIVSPQSKKLTINTSTCMKQGLLISDDAQKELEKLGVIFK